MTKRLLTSLLFISLFSQSIASYAQSEEIYLIEKPDGTVAVHHYFIGSKDTLEDAINNAGLSGLPMKNITQSDIPASKEDRKYWKKNTGIGKAITIDLVKKQADIDLKTAQDAQKAALLTKLKITEEEAKLLKEFK